MNRLKYSIVIIGSGIAGLYSAIKLSESDKTDKILLVTKSTLGESNSRYAQGGIAGVLKGNINDCIDLHVKDTNNAGDGLTNTCVAKNISLKSNKAIEDLVKYGVKFDKSKNELSLTLEGAHSVKRVLHAGGDATGKNIEKTLTSIVKKNPKINILEETMAIDIIAENNQAKGIILLDKKSQYTLVNSSNIIISTGGIGQVYNNTTNPKIATGDGIAICSRAGAAMQDMEFVQFHPTSLAIDTGDFRFLISEALRGEGAKLKNINNELFTCKYDERGDLAPRDIVARAIFNEMKNTNSKNVFLDATLISGTRLDERFPNIYNVCKEAGIDITKDYIPVFPAAHYFMGGVKTDTNAQTEIKGLYALGEAACTSFHGANRLASNSLLECVVLADNISEYIIENYEKIKEISNIDFDFKQENKKQLDSNQLKKELQNLMWKYAGIERNENVLTKALNYINDVKNELEEYSFNNFSDYEYKNMIDVAQMIVTCALNRKESRGAHYRSDYQQKDEIAYHSYIKNGEYFKDGIKITT